MNHDDLYESAKDGLLEGLLQHSFEIDASDPTAYYEPALDGVGQVLPVLDEEDRDIMLHREAHFAGSFPLMLQAYEEDEISAVLPITPKRIRALFELEQKLGKNLAPFILHAADAQKIATVRKMYRLLREAAESRQDPKLQAISELLLSEKEPEEAAKQAASFGPELIPSLLTVVDNEVLYDPLFPGYGMAPVAAIYALGELHAEAAIFPLFALLQNGNFDVESAAISALVSIGEKAKNLCINALHARPLSNDNEKASCVLAAFSCDEEIATAILQELKDPQVIKREPLVFYLLACCEGLPKTKQQEFLALAKEATLPKRVKDEMLLISKVW